MLHTEKLLVIVLSKSHFCKRYTLFWSCELNLENMQLVQTSHLNLVATLIVISTIFAHKNVNLLRLKLYQTVEIFKHSWNVVSNPDPCRYRKRNQTKNYLMHPVYDLDIKNLVHLVKMWHTALH